MSDSALKFLPAQLLEFDVIVCKTILSIQKFFNLTEYKEIIEKKIHCPLCMREYRFEFDTDFNFLIISFFK